MASAYRPICNTPHNQLLAALPAAEWARWNAHIELAELSAHQVLCPAGKCPEYAYFPTTAIVSLMYLTQEGSSAEVAVVGNDGVAGMSLFLGADVATSEVVVQSAGYALRVGAQFVKSEMERSNALGKVVLRYAQSVLAQIAQTAVCNRYHSIDQQLCRRLLLGLDRLPTDELDMTHELAANLLGVRREGVTHAAHKLQLAGLISYHRGHIVVLDRPRLEKRTCECYAIAKKEYSRLTLPPMLMAA
jgi:CRP-like cAMP-binding protein